jgi:hypothetical protein
LLRIRLTGVVWHSLRIGEMRLLVHRSRCDRRATVLAIR